MGMAIQQPRAESVLQLGNAPADGRMIQAQPPPGTQKLARPRNRQKHPRLIPVRIHVAAPSFGGICPRSP